MRIKEDLALLGSLKKVKAGACFPLLDSSNINIYRS